MSNFQGDTIMKIEKSGIFTGLSTKINVTEDLLNVVSAIHILINMSQGQKLFLTQYLRQLSRWPLYNTDST